MAAPVSVNVETNGLGTAKVFYGSEYGNAEVHFYPKLGVLIDYEYHYEFTNTYIPESGKDPETYEGYDTCNGCTWMGQDENGPLAIKCVGGSGDYIVNVVMFWIQKEMMR